MSVRLLTGKIRERLNEIHVWSFLLLFTGLSMLMFHTCTGNRVVYAGQLAGEEDTEIAVDLDSKGEGYAAVLYDNTNGLPTSEANAIVETSEGFLWIGSYSGLIRYDGNTFERIDSTTGIASVVTLYVDSKERLWIGTNDNGAAVMEKGEYRMFSMENGLGSDTVRSIIEDAKGNIYIATTRGIAVVDEEMSLHTIDDQKISEEYVREIRLGADGIIYGVTMNGAVFTIRDELLTGFYDASELGVSDSHFVYPDPDHPGYVYLGTKQSDLYYGDLKNGFQDPKRINVAPLEYINSVEKHNDQIWICADNGIGFVKDDGVHLPKNIPMNSAVEDMITDYQGNLWFVSSRQGVMKIVPSRFMDVFARNDIKEALVNSTCMYGNQLFMGCNTGLMVLGEDGLEEELPVKASSASGGKLGDRDLIQLLEGCKVRSVIRDSKNRIWISSFSEYPLIRYENGSATCFTVSDGLPSERVRTVIERTDSSFLAACTGGMALIEDDRVVQVYGESEGILNAEILTVAEGEKGDMVIGTDGGGIYVVSDGAGQAVHLGKESGLTSEVIMRIKKDISREIFWIVTSNSIAYMDADYKITTIRKFPYSNNFDLYETKKGDVWILSSNGIYVASAEELLANDKIEPVYYGKDDGLTNIATANSYSELTSDGDLYIAGSTGVAKVNIEDTFDNVSDVKMAVPFVVADQEAIYPDSEGAFTIPSSVKKLSIYSFVYNYTLMNPDVTYCLDGFDQRKTTVKRSNLSSVDYTNLRGGDYQFVIQLKDSMGQDTNEMSVRIVKEKAFYEVLWFNLLCLAAAILIVVEIIRLYIHRKTKAFLKKQEEDKALIRGIVKGFAKTVDMKDQYTNGHSFRVADYTVKLAKELGYDEDTVEQYYNIALLHDIGKIGIPDEVLNKPGKLTDEEFATIKSHTSLGYEVLKDIHIMPELAIGAGSHHERPDGRGYPRGLKGEEIPRVAQIIAVADTFDAMYSNRPYRKRMNFEKAVSIIKENAGTQLTTDVVEAFLRLVEKGEFRAPDDHGGGSTEDISNIHKKFEENDSAQTADANG